MHSHMTLCLSIGASATNNRANINQFEFLQNEHKFDWSVNFWLIFCWHFERLISASELNLSISVNSMNYFFSTRNIIPELQMSFSYFNKNNVKFE